jgi:hypothetical protein
MQNTRSINTVVNTTSSTNKMKEIRDSISKALLTGALNSLATPILFEGSDMAQVHIPILGDFIIPDMALFFAGGFLGQLASDFTHDSLYPTIARGGKTNDTPAMLASLTAYSAVQLPMIGWMGGLNDYTLLAKYLVLSGAVHYGSEKVFHDFLQAR